ncbi:MAG: 50S ribosomal protein L10 [Chloroflexota bacterium]|nr:MAG: 50S ribosomal protein L10 [Chloroflexota bacterium]
MPTERKAALIDGIEQRLKLAEVAILSDYRGISVAQIGQLRGQLRSSGAEFHVVKNTLTRIAARRVGISGLDAFLEGPTAITFVSSDIGAAARTLRDALRTMPMLAVKAAIVGGQVIGAEQATSLADLPSKLVLQAQLAGAIQGPLTKLVGVLNGAVSNIVYVLEARAKQLEEAA